MAAMITKTVDERGRLSLGKKFANRHMIVRTLAGGVIQLVPAEIVPAREAWLYKNRKALEAVLEGLEQAGQGELVDGPELGDEDGDED